MKKNNLVKMNPYLFLNTEILKVLIDKTPIADKNVYKAIKLCQEPQSIDDLLNNHEIPSNVIDLLLKYDVIMPLDMLWKQGFFSTLDIEICTHCNHRCEYCPEKKYPKKPRFMENDLFSDIINKTKNYPSITKIALNSYNEPLLDPGLLDKLDIVSKTDIKVNLYTNGSLLSSDKLDAIIERNVLRAIYFNIPSLDEFVYHQKTGSNSYHNTIRNVEYAIQKNVNIILVVLGQGAERGKILKEFNERYNNYPNVEIMHWFIMDQAGLLDNKYSHNINIKDRLTGCIRYMDYLLISVEGNFFICCQDYNQREIYGNIRDGEIKDIVNSEAAITLRKKIFGEIESDSDFICRKCYDMHLSQICTRSNSKLILDENLSEVTNDIIKKYIKSLETS